MYKRLDKTLEKTDAALITSPHNLRYFSGFTGGEGAALIYGGGRILFTDSRYTEQAERESADFSVEQTNDYIGAAAKAAKDKGFETLAFEDFEMSVAEFNRLRGALDGVRLKGLGDSADALRAVKTETELLKLEKAEDIACRAFRHILGFIKEGVTEKEIAAEIEYFMKKNGGEKTSFDTIAISGKKTSLPHGTPTEKRIENGDLVTMDFGCVYGGYCSDMTRTVAVGEPSDELKRIYETVKAAQQTGLDILCEGIIGKVADAAARQVIEKAGYGKYFGHSLGHGVGLRIHELPNLSPRSETVLKKNMVVTCEPGIYVPGVGGVRIEDMVCITENGIRNFTYETKELIVL